MKFLLVKAVAAAIALGSMVSCTSGLSADSSSPRLLTKAQARKLALGGSSVGLPSAANVALLQSASSLPKDKWGRPTYSDRTRHRYVRTTAYSCQENEPGAYGSLSASGARLKYGRVRSAAADWSRYPVGTTFKIKGLPYLYVIDDYGSELVGTNTIDIYHPSLSSMRRWATRDAEISIVQWGSWERTANLLRQRTKYPHCARMYYATVRKLRSGNYASTSGYSRNAL